MSGGPGADVVVVCGVPRSGTSMVMQMLDAGGLPILHDQVRGPDRDNPRGYFELAAVKGSRDDVGWVERAAGRAVKVPHVLAAHLPLDRVYRFILVRRDLRAVVASQAAMLARLQRPGAALTEAQLIAAYERQLDELTTLLDARPGARRLELRYEDVLADPAGQAARLDAFLGGGLDRAAMAAAVDPRLWRCGR